MMTKLLLSIYDTILITVVFSVAMIVWLVLCITPKFLVNLVINVFYGVILAYALILLGITLLFNFKNKP